MHRKETPRISQQRAALSERNMSDSGDIGEKPYKRQGPSSVLCYV